MKRLSAIIAITASSLLCPASSALADLGHQLYVKAKQYYIEEDYAQTVRYLNRYKKADRKFLRENPEILAKINQVIDYSKTLSSTSLSLQGVGQPPLLPEGDQY
jgi:triacylglycerol esterase/lipase EstA (alpha/beta hydrolase family)